LNGTIQLGSTADPFADQALSRRSNGIEVRYAIAIEEE